MITRGKQLQYLVHFDYVQGKKKEYVVCEGRDRVKPLLRKKYGLSVRVRAVHRVD